MSEADDDVATPDASPQTLIITVGDHSYTVEPSDAPITIGREFPAQVQIADARISRTHARLEVTGGHWIVTDHSTNGVFLGGARQPSVVLVDGITLHLGNPEGIAVTFTLSPAGDHVKTATAAAADDETPEGEDTEDFPDDLGEFTEEIDVTNPGIARAGAAVAARRRELDIAQRTLAKDKIMNAGALIAFEKGRSWPRRSTLAKLERVLGWEPGTIERLRFGEQSDTEPGEHTEVLTGTVQAPLMAQAVEVALDAIRAQIDALPPPREDAFTPRVTSILADLRKLEAVAANAARTATGATDVALSLSAVRRLYRELMLRAARAPRASFGQRLFAARHGAELSTEEAANAAGVSAEAIAAAEADSPVSAEASTAVKALLRSLSQR